MGAILVAVGVAIVAYIAINVLFPGVAPEEKENFTQQALNRIFEENSAHKASAEDDAKIALRNQLEDDTPWVRQFYGTPFTRPMYEALLQSGFREQAAAISFAMLAGMPILTIALASAGFPILYALLGGILGPYAIAYAFCRRKVKKRNLAFLNQFPDVLDMAARSVRAGFPLNTAIQMIAENMEEPSRSEFRYVLNDIGVGRNINQALTRLSARVNEQDVRFFAVMVAIQQETGGNLAEVVTNLSRVLRQRKQLRDKIRALTSEGRATGWILSGLPVFIFCTLYVMQPEYLEPLWTNPLGMMFLGTAIGLVVTCQIIIRRMIAFEI